MTYNKFSLEDASQSSAKKWLVSPRSTFWVRVRVTATRRFVDLNGLAKASTWASFYRCYRSKIQVSVRSFFRDHFQINPKQLMIHLQTQKRSTYIQPTKRKTKTCPPASAWHSNQKSRSTRPHRKSRSASKQHHDYPCESSTERTSGNKLPSMWQLAWAHFGWNLMSTNMGGEVSPPRIVCFFWQRQPFVKR